MKEINNSVNYFGYVDQVDMLTEEELQRLLDVARHRPLRDRMTVRRGKHAGQQKATEAFAGLSGDESRASDFGVLLGE